MIGVGQEDEIEEITLQPEIWWHDVIYHEEDQCMKWPQSIDFHIFWSRLAEGAVILWTSRFHLGLVKNGKQQGSWSLVSGGDTVRTGSGQFDFRYNSI